MYQYLYGEFSDEQIREAAKQMHNDIHKLLLYKDYHVEDEIFKDDEEFLNYYEKLLFKFGGLNELFHEPPVLVSLMALLQAGFDAVQDNRFSYLKFRRAILDCHGYIATMFEGVDSCQDYLQQDV